VRLQYAWPQPQPLNSRKDVQSLIDVTSQLLGFASEYLSEARVDASNLEAVEVSAGDVAQVASSLTRALLQLLTLMGYTEVDEEFLKAFDVIVDRAIQSTAGGESGIS